MKIEQGLSRLQRGGGSVIVNADGTVSVVGNTDITGTLAVTGAATFGSGPNTFGGTSSHFASVLHIEGQGSGNVFGLSFSRVANNDEWGVLISNNDFILRWKDGTSEVDGLILRDTTGNLELPGTLLCPGLITATAGVLYGTTVTLTEGAADRLDLASGDDFHLVTGSIGVGTLPPAPGGGINLSGDITFIGSTKVLNMGASNTIINIGASGTDFTTTGGLVLADILDVTGISTFNDDVLVPTSDVRIGAGSASHSGVTPLFQIHTNISNKRLSGSTYFNDDNAGVIWSLAKSKSDTLGTIVYPASGDNLGGIWWEGANEAATRFEPGVKVFALAGSTWTATNRESDLVFQTVSSGATALTTILTLSNGGGKFAGALEIDGALNHDGSTAGLYGVTPVTRPGTWIITNDVGDRAFDANATTLDELADVVATLIRDMAALGATGAVA